MAVGTFDEHLKSDLDWVRFYILDAKGPDFRLPNETIEAVLASKGNDRFAAAALLFRNTVVFSTDTEVVSKSIDDLSLTFGRKNKETALEDHLAWLESQAITRPFIQML